MNRHGLLIEYEYCTGCHTCEVACKQEHNFPPGRCGIKVNEIIMETPHKVAIDYIPFPTALCTLCGHRTAEGDLPACVRHCQAACMYYGSLGELSQMLETKKRAVLFAPR